MNSNIDMYVHPLIAENARLREVIRKQAELIVRQQEQITTLLQRVAVLEEQLRKNSQNSSKPPSSDLPSVDRQRKKSATGRKRGGQPGHKGKKRELLPPEQVDEMVEIKPESCGECGTELAGVDPTPLRHQVTEIPPILPHVTEYRLHTLTCPCCGEKNYGQLPEGVPHGAFGFRLQGIVVLCTGAYQLSKRSVLALLADVLGVGMALGSISQCEKNASAALATPVAEAREFVQKQPVANADETGWREAKKRAWLWVAVTELVTVFLVHGSRGKKAAQELLGRFTGILGSDRWGAYNDRDLSQRQFCWAHLIRDFRAMSERPGNAARIGRDLLQAAKTLFSLWHGFQDGIGDRANLQNRASPVESKVKSLLEEGASCSDGKTSGTCRQLLKGFPALWTFLRVHGVEPTNNAAERSLRKGVLWRKGSFGTDSAEGSRFAERIMTVVATCRQQNRNVLEFLVATLKADHGNLQSPSLLPKQDSTIPKTT